MCNRIRVRKTRVEILRIAEKIYGSKTNTVKAQKYLDIRIKVIKYPENTSIGRTYDLGHKIPFSNWENCVTRTNDRKPAMGLKNH